MSLIGIMRLSVAALLSFYISGCSLYEIKKESEAISSAGEISGDINATSDIDAPIKVLLFLKDNHSFNLVEEYSLQNDGTYKFFVTPATYFIAAYQDVNKDGSPQESEPAVIYGGKNAEDANPIIVDANSQIKITTLTISQPLDPQRKKPDTTLTAIDDHTGEQISLNDPKFNREIGTLGLWKPLTFNEQYGAGLYLLGPYNSKLTPVIFIHGAGGNPREFSDLIDALDVNRYQPFVLHYPSGASLDIVSEYLLRSINKLQSKHQFQQFVLVAHSMGGLVMRSLVMKYQMNRQEANILFAISINSPMMGMSSASQGVKMSPIVVPSWYDVAENSPFIKQIHEWPWPNKIPYHLIFSYQTGKSSDGVVPLESQIPISLQNEAVKIYGFKAGHALVLTEPEFITTFSSIMDPLQPLR